MPCTGRFTLRRASLITRSVDSRFSYTLGFHDMLWAAHIRHHDARGTADDPDFAETPGDGLWKWFSAFMIRYTTVRQILVMTGYMWVVSAISVSLWNTMVLWALPALLSALQLFYFGIYQRIDPMRHRLRITIAPEP